MNFPDVVGIIGVICYQVAYAGLQLGHFRQNDLRYIGLNILGPACLLFSLVFNFNLAAVVTQVLWLVVTALGLAKVIRARGKPMPCAAQDSPKNQGQTP
jgi:hypothetical protein